MPNHKRDWSLPASRRAPETAPQGRAHIAVECHKVRDPKAVEHREQQQRVFGRLSERFSLFDQQTCPLRRRLGFRRAYPLIWMSGVMSATCSLICSRRSAGVAGKVVIWSRARVN